MKNTRDNHREGVLRKELHEQRQQGMAPRAETWGGRPNAKKNRRTARADVKKVLKEIH